MLITLKVEKEALNLIEKEFLLAFALSLRRLNMKNGFRILLLVIVTLVLYGDLTTQVWSYPIRIISLFYYVL